MSFITSDASFTNVHVTKNIIFKDKLFLDESFNVNANNVYVNDIFINGMSLKSNVEFYNRSFNSDRSSSVTKDVDDVYMCMKLRGDRNLHNNDTSLIIGGCLNESSGDYSICIGGQYNEAYGQHSVVLGGSENQSIGDFSLSAGVHAIASHKNSFVWNDSTGTQLQSTMEKQILLGASNGTMFKLPLSRTLQTHHIPEGFACWCWDDVSNSLALKTKQHNTLYKSTLPTMTHEIKVVISDDRVDIVNPDDT
jgi:hypothetical protein